MTSICVGTSIAVLRALANQRLGFLAQVDCAVNVHLFSLTATGGASDPTCDNSYFLAASANKNNITLLIRM